MRRYPSRIIPEHVHPWVACDRDQALIFVWFQDQKVEVRIVPDLLGLYSRLVEWLQLPKQGLRKVEFIAKGIIQGHTQRVGYFRDAYTVMSPGVILVENVTAAWHYYRAAVASTIQWPTKPVITV